MIKENEILMDDLYSALSTFFKISPIFSVTKEKKKFNQASVGEICTCSDAFNFDLKTIDLNFNIINHAT